MPAQRLKRSDTSFFIATRNAGQGFLLRALAIAVGAHANEFSPDATLDAELTRLSYARHDRPILIADLATLSAQGAAPGESVKQLLVRHPAVGIIVIADECLALTASQEVFLKRSGALGAFPALSHLRPQETLLPVLSCALGVPVTELGQVDISPYLTVLAQEHDLTTPLDDAQSALAKLPTRGFTLKSLIDELKGPSGFKINDRSYRLKAYPECLIASEGVDVLCALTGASRPSAVALGRALQHLGCLHHVTGDHAFSDESLFFRFSPPTESSERLDLALLLEQAQGAEGFALEDRNYLGKRYGASFVGKDAADWLRRHGRLGRCEAVRVGQLLLQLHAFRHVTDAHPFADWDYFYRFT